MTLSYVVEVDKAKTFKAKAMNFKTKAKKPQNFRPL